MIMSRQQSQERQNQMYPHRSQTQARQKTFRPPEVQNLTTWEYLQEVCDFEKNQCKVPFGGAPQPPSSVELALDHMHKLGDDYGDWLET